MYEFDEFAVYIIKSPRKLSKLISVYIYIDGAQRNSHIIPSALHTLPLYYIICTSRNKRLCIWGDRQGKKIKSRKDTYRSSVCVCVCARVFIDPKNNVACEDFALCRAARFIPTNGNRVLAKVKFVFRLIWPSFFRGRLMSRWLRGGERDWAGFCVYMCMYGIRGISVCHSVLILTKHFFFLVSGMNLQVLIFHIRLFLCCCGKSHMSILNASYLHQFSAHKPQQKKIKGKDQLYT